MLLHKFKHGTDEWHAKRVEFPFTSTASTAIASSGKGIETHVHEKMLIKHGLEERREVWTEAIGRGRFLEPDGIQEYEIVTGVLVEAVGFITNKKYLLAGDSPDGLVGENGMIEAKCLNEKKFLKFKKDKKVPSGHMWQCQWHLLIGEREWCDYFIYHPDHGIEVLRIYPNLEKQIKLQAGLKYAQALWFKAEKKYE